MATFEYETITFDDMQMTVDESNIQPNEHAYVDQPKAKDSSQMQKTVDETDMRADLQEIETISHCVDIQKTVDHSDLCPANKQRSYQDLIKDGPTQGSNGAEKPELQELNLDKIKTVYKNIRDVNILMTGLTGSGKSSLATALLGHKQGDAGACEEEGEMIAEGCTKTTKGKTSVLPQCIGIRIWDAPGLGEGKRKDRKYLDEVLTVWNRCRKKDLVIFCVKAGTRFVDGKTNNDVKAMIDLTKKLGKEVWTYTIIALTHTDLLAAQYPAMRKGEKKIEIFNGKIEEFEREIKKNLEKHVKIKPCVAQNIKIVPTSHNSIPKLFNGKDWFTNLWFSCLDTIPTTEGKEAMMCHNQSRFGCDIILTDEFCPAKLLAERKEWQELGTKVGALGFLSVFPPLGLVTLPVGRAIGRRYAENQYDKTFDVKNGENKLDVKEQGQDQELKQMN